MADLNTLSEEEQARRRAKYLVDLLWHVGAFVIINVSLWVLDLTLGAGGLQWAPWITAIWGFALAFHALAWTIEGRQLERRLTERLLARRHHAAQ